MRLKSLAFTVAAAALAGLPASAGLAQEGTVGDCISDGLYGNEPNIRARRPRGAGARFAGRRTRRSEPVAWTVRQQPG